MIWRQDVGSFYWHIHHGLLIEQSTEPIKERIKYIKKEKSISERKLRLHLLKKAKIPKYLEEPIRGYVSIGRPISRDDVDEILELHKNQCDPNCPFEQEDGRTIYGDILTVLDDLKPEYGLLGQGRRLWKS